MLTEMTISLSVFLQLASFVFVLGGAYWLLMNTSKKLDAHAESTKHELEVLLTKVENLSDATHDSFKDIAREQTEMKIAVGKLETSMRAEMNGVNQRFTFLERGLPK